MKDWDVSEMEAMNKPNVEKRIKIFRDESLQKCELAINEFLTINKNIDLIDVKELRTSHNWAFLFIYKIKESE